MIWTSLSVLLVAHPLLIIAIKLIVRAAIGVLKVLAVVIDELPILALLCFSGFPAHLFRAPIDEKSG